MYGWTHAHAGIVTVAVLAAFVGVIYLFESTRFGGWADRKLGFRDPADKYLDDY